MRCLIGEKYSYTNPSFASLPAFCRIDLSPNVGLHDEHAHTTASNRRSLLRFLALNDCLGRLTWGPRTAFFLSVAFFSVFGDTNLMDGAWLHQIPPGRAGR